MDIFAQKLATVVKKARNEQGLTQQQVADLADCNVRTVLKIENCRGNPKIETVLSLIHTLKIDPREILSPEMERQSPAIWQLRNAVADCSDQEAVALIPVIESVLKAIRASSPDKIE